MLHAQFRPCRPCCDAGPVEPARCYSAIRRDRYTRAVLPHPAQSDAPPLPSATSSYGPAGVDTRPGPHEVAILIPALNEEPIIGPAVSRAWATGAREVLVADGGSHDATGARAREAGARVVHSPRGRGRQLNRAAAAAGSRVLLFLHADNWVEPGALAQIEEALEDRGVLGGAFLQQIEARGAAYRMLERGNAWRARFARLPYGDQGIFVRRDTFEALGGFDNVDLMEDVLFMRRFRRLARPVLLPGPIHVSPRRWQQSGVVRQTLRNWSLLTAARLGVPPDRLARYYPPQGGRRDY